MSCSRHVNGGRINVRLNGVQLPEVDCFKCLGSQVTAIERCESDAVHGMNEGHQAWAALKSVLCNRSLRIKANKSLYEGVIVPTALHGAEAWGMRSAERRKVNVLEMKCLGSLVGVSEWIEFGMKRCVEELEQEWIWRVEWMREY